MPKSYFTKKQISYILYVVVLISLKKYHNEIRKSEIKINIKYYVMSTAAVF